MSQKYLFEKLGAPLANSRWSWGSVRADGTVFLRVWEDEVKKRDGTLQVLVGWEIDEDDESEDPKPGYQERMRHIELVEGGATCFLIMCKAEDVAAIPRKVKEFHSETVFPGGKLVRDDDGAWWLELRPRKPISEVLRCSKAPLKRRRP